MKTFLAGLTMALLAGIAIGQEQKPAAAAEKPAAAAPAPAPEKKEMKVESGKPARHREDSDARHCLDLPTQREIIICSEKYLKG